jgi:DNA-binding transcriptional regulator YiaG
MVRDSRIYATCVCWEQQGRAKPNAQAALLISLVRKYPDMFVRLAGT